MPDCVGDEFADVFMTHLYLTMPGNEPCRVLPPEKVAEYEETVRGAAEYAAKAGKPIMTTEICWGSFDDASRVLLIEHNVRICRKYGLGIFAYALYESDFADLHRPEQGRLSPDIGHLEFIRRDGSLRPGHDIINRFFDSVLKDD